MSENFQERLDQLIAAHVPGGSLTRPFYVDPEIFDWDIERVFKRYWLPIAFSSRIRSPGDYFLYEIAGEQIIVVRGTDDKVYAHYNVCRHRGSRLCLEKEGNKTKFVCPYHAWSYAHDGSFVNARHLYEETDKDSLSLFSVHAREMEGLIFIFLGEDIADFEPIVQDFTPYIKPHGLARTKICHKVQFQIEANWKVVAENQWECYHCAPAHPELAQVMTYVRAHNSPARAVERLKFEEEWVEFAKSIGHMSGGMDGTGPDAWYGVRRTPIQPGFSVQTADGQPAALLLGDLKQYDGAVTGLNFYPLSFAVINNDFAVLLRFTPVAPVLTDIELTWVVHEDAVEGVDYNVDRIKWMWEKTGEKDAMICENNQKGVNSKFYKPGPHSKMEDRIDHMIHWYLRQVAPHPDQLPPYQPRSSKSSRQLHLILAESNQPDQDIARH